MTDTSIVIVVGASEEEFDYIKQYLSDWQCVAASLNDEETEVSSIPPAAKLAIVYARKNQKNTLAICEQVRNPPGSSAVPILLAISRYMITQGSAVKRMGNTTFIIIPFEEKELRDKIEQLKKELQNHGPDGS
jgi:response regulator RpfG family c-di-GMP phosphodiesterase